MIANITGTTTRTKDRNIKKYLKNLFMFEAPHVYDFVHVTILSLNVIALLTILNICKEENVL